MTSEVNGKSITSIEKRIDAIRLSDKPKTKANQAKIKRLQSTLNKLYVEYKHKLMTLENSNKDKLMFLLIGGAELPPPFH